MQVGVYDRDDQMCQYEDCTEIDLLPARCSDCHKRFCSHHLSHGAHHCPAVMDVRVGTCPVCHRVVLLEYPRQNVDEAVSRHLDRGCRDVLPGSASYSSATAKRKLGQAGGRRLGGSAPVCSIQDCHEASETRVKCDQCGQTFCLQHRGPLQHHCRAAAAARSTVASSPSEQHAGVVMSPLGGKAVSVARLLTHPTNTPEKAVGKATELPSDMVTGLVCFLIPASVFKKSGPADCDKFEPVPSFFMFMPKKIALGRLLDTAVDRAAMNSPAVRTGKPWNLFAVTLPIHAETRAAYHPPLPLSTVVGKSPIGEVERTVLFLSPLQTLPECAIEAVQNLERNKVLQSTSLSSSQGCQVM
ncbi:putative AN1-like Zinc finger containing protein [Leishmania naiffi]|uniref:AN1-like Zinc finger containing protein n=1 Tax=Leishmania naiffi TaxID=5678 RepID=A0AAW3C0D6_9TRYP